MSPETGREAMRTPANRDHDDAAHAAHAAKDERGSGDDVPVEMASWAGATDAERRAWLRSGVVPVDYPGPVAADWPELVAIVEERARTERQAQQDKGGKEKWWQFLRPRPELHAAISGLDRVLVIARAGQQCAFTFLEAGVVYSDQLIVFPFDTYTAFCTLQSRPHEIWARFLGSSMKDDLRVQEPLLARQFPEQTLGGLDDTRSVKLLQRSRYRVHSGAKIPWTTPTPGGIPMEPKLKHLEFIQDVVNRLASDSFRIKGWSVVLVAALFVLLARQGRADLLFIGLIPVIFFWGLDGYFLWQERLFRALYDHVRSLDDSAVDFSMDTSPFRTSYSRTWLGAALSRTLVFFHGALVVAIVLVIAVG